MLKITRIMCLCTTNSGPYWEHEIPMTRWPEIKFEATFSGAEFSSRDDILKIVDPKLTEIENRSSRFKVTIEEIPQEINTKESILMNSQVGSDGITLGRIIESHVVNPCNDKLTITVVDQPGAGGANHHYCVKGFDTRTNPSANIDCKDQLDILFQNGPINEAGVNGITQEVLLAIVQDRLQSFQDGPYKTVENQKALDAVKEAQHWLQFRTLKRMARGVEGTHTK